MVDFSAFRGWRPSPENASEVAAVPYDVVNTEEARAEVAGHPDSILRVTRPDVELPDGASLYDERAYATARAAFQRLVDSEILREDQNPHFYAYAQTMGDHRQVGLVGLASASDYWADRIKKHEFTRPTKEDDRMRHIEAVRSHLGPVFMTYRAHEGIDGIVREIVSLPAAVDFVAPDGIRHELWPIGQSETIAQLELGFSELSALYIADGHHRAAAAGRIGRDAADGEARGHFLAVAFPDSSLKILPYNRLLTSVTDEVRTHLMDNLARYFDCEPLPSAAEPATKGTFSMYAEGHWHRLTIKSDAAPDPLDPVASLDVSVLQELVLNPIFGIEDPRTDERIEFVGGIRGLSELERRADHHRGVAFALYPTSLDELMNIADSGEVMPPKSTWFEPKLRTGMVVSRY